MLGVSLSLIAGAVVASLSAGTPSRSELAISVKPGSAVIFVDGVRRGSASKARRIRLSPGPHLVRVVYRKDEHQESVTVARGKKTSWSWDFEDDEKAEVQVAHQEAKAGRATVAFHQRSDAPRSATGAGWLDPIPQDSPATEKPESAVRHRAALDLLAALPSISPVQAAAPQSKAPKSRRHVKAKQHQAS
jgi:hypothetical protein